MIAALIETLSDSLTVVCAEGMRMRCVQHCFRVSLMPCPSLPKRMTASPSKRRNCPTSTPSRAVPMIGQVRVGRKVVRSTCSWIVSAPSAPAVACITFGLYGSTQPSPKSRVRIPSQSHSRIIVPRLPGFWMPSRATTIPLILPERVGLSEGLWKAAIISLGDSRSESLRYWAIGTCRTISSGMHASKCVFVPSGTAISLGRKNCNRGAIAFEPSARKSPRLSRYFLCSRAVSVFVSWLDIIITCLMIPSLSIEGMLPPHL